MFPVSKRRNFISGSINKHNKHFFDVTYSWVSVHLFGTKFTRYKCSFWLLPKMNKSSNYTTNNWSITSRSTELVRIWNVNGALHNPNVFTIYSNRPYFVLKLVFSISSGWNPTWRELVLNQFLKKLALPQIGQTFHPYQRPLCFSFFVLSLVLNSPPPLSETLPFFAAWELHKAFLDRILLDSTFLFMYSFAATNFA